MRERYLSTISERNRGVLEARNHLGLTQEPTLRQAAHRIDTVLGPPVSLNPEARQNIINFLTDLRKKESEARILQAMSTEDFATFYSTAHMGEFDESNNPSRFTHHEILSVVERRAVALFEIGQYKEHARYLQLAQWHNALAKHLKAALRP